MFLDGAGGGLPPFICAGTISLRIAEPDNCARAETAAVSPFSRRRIPVFSPVQAEKAVKSRYALLLQNRAFLSEKCIKYTFICRIQSEFFSNTAV